MEPMASILDKLKAFAKSGEDFFAGLTRRENRARRNPVTSCMMGLYNSSHGIIFRLKS